jgi:hypothetical protein
MFAMAFVPKTPKYTIPTREIGVVCYPEQKGIGIQFADPEGGHIFITIPGAMVPVLAEALKQTAERYPVALTWPPAPYAAR